jgi:hypothetical protein
VTREEWDADLRKVRVALSGIGPLALHGPRPEPEPEPLLTPSFQTTGGSKIILNACAASGPDDASLQLEIRLGTACQAATYLSNDDRRRLAELLLRGLPEAEPRVAVASGEPEPSEPLRSARSAVRSAEHEADRCRYSTSGRFERDALRALLQWAEERERGG